MIILFYFIILFIIYYKAKSVVTFFVLLQIMSLSGMMLIGLEYPINTIFKFFNLILTIVLLTLIIAPWGEYKEIKEITFSDEAKLLNVTKFLIIISILPFITFIATSAFVLIMVENVNDFKYAEGVSTDFYYSLPFNVKAIIISNYLYFFSYFLIPLHFYYLFKKKYKLSIWCFIFSLNIILYGVTYFSRSVYIHYFFIYMAFLILLYGTLESKIQSVIKKSLIVSIVLITIYFINITIKRFTEDKLYEGTIPDKSYIKDPVSFSYFDYLSQWYYNSMTLLESYKFEIFNGQITTQSVLSLFGQYGIITYDSNSYTLLRQKMWLDNWCSFNGFVAYSIYDYGYILTFVFTIFYYLIVLKLKPKNNQVSLLNLFIIVLLIQIPLLAIFYSAAGGIFMPLLFYIPIFLYLRVKVKK